MSAVRSFTPRTRPTSESRTDKDTGCCGGCKETLSVFSKLVLVKIFGLAIYVLDILTDFNAAYWDYKAGDDLFAYITVGLIFAPGTLFSAYLFCDYITRYIGEIACLKAPIWIVVSPLLPLWVIARGLTDIGAGIVATLCPARRTKLNETCSRPSRIYLVKFLEAFAEAAPQLLLRLFRVASRSPRQFSDLRTSEIIQITFSLLTLALKVVSTHQKSVSTQQVINGNTEIDAKYSLPWYLKIVALLWWLCFLASRFEALALFCASYGYWVLVVVGIHVVLVFLMQTIMDNNDRLKRIFIYLFGAFVFIFAYIQFNLRARFKIAAWFPYTIFAVLLFVENSVMLTFWSFDQHSRLPDHRNATVPGAIPTAALINSTASSREATVGFLENAENLNTHWRTLIFLHYGVFGAGIIFMTCVFWCASVCGHDDEGQSETKTSSHVEMQTLMTR